MKNAVWIAINICVLVNATPSQNTSDDYTKLLEEIIAAREKAAPQEGVTIAIHPPMPWETVPQEFEFSPVEEIKYQMRDKLQLNSNYR